MIRLLLFVLLAFFSWTAHSATPPGAEGFIEIEPYSPESKEFSCANSSAEEWAVRIEQKKLRIAPAKRHTEVTLEIDGGRFTGKDGGEFEGDLRFRKGKQSQTLFKENISALFSVSNDRVIAFGGLAHLGSDDGYMLIISKSPKNFGWQVDKKIKLPANPYAVTVKDIGSFYFVTGEGLYLADVMTEKAELLKATSTTGLYPNSLAVGEGKHIYVGMRHAVAHFIPAGSGYTVKWLVKARCSGT